MKQNNIIGVIVIIVVALGVFIFWRSRPQQKQSDNVAQQQSSSDQSSAIIPSSSQKDYNNMHRITLVTNFGTIQFETYDADAPKTVENFITLAKKGFYDNLTFHRVIKGFMIQGGDPNGNGTGGPGYKFEDELNPATQSYQNGYRKGVVAMANAGPNTNGSQFFIMLEDYPLPNNYTIFGHVVSGQDVVDAIGNTKTGPNDKPLEPVIVKNVKVEEK